MTEPIRRRRFTDLDAAVVLLIVLTIGVALALVIAVMRQHAPPPRERLLGSAPIFASACWTTGYPVPPGCIFGLSGITGVIESAYTYEASLLEGEVPAGDYDYMLDGHQELVKLPGGSWNRYAYYGAVYVQGSGCVLEYGTPNGGRFAFLHMSQQTSGCATMAPASLGTARQQSSLSGDELTALAASRILHRGLRAASSLPGGHTVGTSRWPDWYIYGNGSCCQADAHLCVVLDARARDWFNFVASGRDKPPWHFPSAAWGEWRKAHHRSWISEWSKPSCKGRKSCLTWPASQWLHQRWLGGVVNHGRWYGPATGRQYGYMRYGFHRGELWCWPHYGTCKAVPS